MQLKRVRNYLPRPRDNNIEISNQVMNLEILTPERRLYSGEVYGVQLPGVDGLFEVLEKHAPLVSALKAGKLKVIKDRTQKDTALYTIQGGFVEVFHNKVTVLVEGAVAADLNR
jgi:F-type H+-transporting ATPase subunit epsilon